MASSAPLFCALLYLVVLACGREIDNDFDTMRSYEFVALFAFVQESVSTTLDVASNSNSMTSDRSDPFASVNLHNGRGTYKAKFPMYTRPTLVIYDDLEYWETIEEEASTCSEVVQVRTHPY
jgi:hypothetical protein